MSDKYVFFWGGPFSQWYPSLFVIDDLHFTCAEQWMMYSKAMMFGDENAAEQIMATTNPRLQKASGRAVLGYKDDIWMADAFDIVVAGNHAKFTQNAELNGFLKDTKSKIIVEASPYDRRWGIGLSMDTPNIEDENIWRGENLLGKAIMKVRVELFGT